MSDLRVSIGSQWLIEILASIAGGATAPSMLEVGSGDGARLALAETAGVEAFGVESGRPSAGGSERCTAAYVVDNLDDVPPHRFDLILLTAPVSTLPPREILYVLATKGAFGPTTTLVVLPNDSWILDDVAAVARELLFSAVVSAGTGLNRRLVATGSDFPQFMQERYVPGTWSEIAAYEHLPRYAFASTMVPRARVLDFGCGSGYGSAVLARSAHTVVGLDVSAEALEFARARHAAPNLEFVQDSSFGATLQQASFDVIVCFEVIEHLNEDAQRTLIASLQNLLAPSGKLLISTPNPRVTALYGANPYHLHELTEIEFADLLRERFSHVTLVEQSVEAGIFLRPKGVSHMLEERRDIAELDGLADPTVFVGVCSPDPIGLLPAVVYPDRARDLIRSRVSALSIQNECLILRYERAKLTRSLQSSEAGRTSAEASVTAVKEEVQRVARDLAEGQAEANAVLEDRDLLRRTYEAAAAERDRYVAALLHEEAERGSEQARADALQEEVADLTVKMVEVHRSMEEFRRSAKLEYDSLDRLMRLEKQRLNRLRLAQRNASTISLSDARRESAEMRQQLDDIESRLADALRDSAEKALQLDDTRCRLSDALRDSAEKILQLDDVGSRLATTSHRLHLIESSTSWRTIRRLAPLLSVARPVARPLLRTGFRVARKMTGRSRPAPPTETHTFLAETPVPVADAERYFEPVTSEPIHVSADTAPEEIAAPTAEVIRPAAGDPHVLHETTLDPVWNETQGIFTLEADETFVRQDNTSTFVPPYVVIPLTAIDPTVSRPKVLHVIPNVHVGGSTQLVIDIVQRLSSSYCHEVITSSLWPGGDHVGLTVHLVADVSPAAMAAMIARVQPDLVHVHYWGLTDDPWYFAAVEAIEAYGVTAIQNVNTPITPIRHDVFSHYVFVSEYVRNTFGEAVVGDCQTSVIHPGIDLARFGVLSPVPDRDDAIGMVYRLEDDKLNEDSIEVFIEVAKRRPRTKVYIIGGGRFLIPYLERTKAAGVRQNFRFTGYVPYEKLPFWYDRFAVFVAPVWKESFGQVAPFAMCKRCVVAGFAVGALSEILGSNETLGTTTSETADIIVRVLDDKNRLRQVGEINHARATRMYDVGEMTSRYEKLYNDVLDRPHGTP